MKTATSSTSRATGWSLAVRGGVGVVALAVFAAFVFDVSARPMSYDEYYSLFEATRTGSFAQALSGHWLRDSHPPFYYASLYLVAQANAGLAVLRSVNLAGALVGAIGVAIVAREHRSMRLGAALFLFAVAANFILLDDLTMLRSYSLQAAAGAAVIFTLAAALRDGALGTASRRVLAIALVAAFNLHVATSLSLVPLLAVVLPALAWRGQWGLARAIAVPALLGGLIFAATSMVQLPYWLHNLSGAVDYSWPKTLQALRDTAVMTAKSNAPMLVFATFGLWRLIARRDAGRAEVLSAAGVLAVAAAAALLLLAAFRRTMLDPYYTVLVQLEVLLAMSLIAAEGLTAMARWRAAAGATALGALAAFAFVQTARHAHSLTGPVTTWWGGPGFVAERRAACPGLALHIVRLPPAFYATVSGPDAAEVTPGYLAAMAQRYGIRVEPAGSRRLSNGCPTLFWIMDPLPPSWSEQGRRNRLLTALRLQGFAVSKLELAYPLDDLIALGS